MSGECSTVTTCWIGYVSSRRRQHRQRRRLLIWSSAAPRGAHYPEDAGNALMLAHASQKRETTEDTAMNEAEAIDQVSVAPGHC